MILRAHLKKILIALLQHWQMMSRRFPLGWQTPAGRRRVQEEKEEMDHQTSAIVKILKE